MAIDDLGYLWLGTEDGLMRYNGYGFRAFFHNPNDSSSIKDDHIRGMQFSDRKLWLATNTSGIISYIPSENSFKNLSLKFNNPDLKNGYKVFLAPNNKLLFSLKNNLICLDQENDSVKLIHLPIGPKECDVNDVVKIQENKYWLATTSAGVLELDIGKCEYKDKDLLRSNTNNCLFKNKSQLFIGTEEGLLFYDLQSKRLEPSVLSDPVNCFYRLDSTSLFIGTDVGLFVYNLTDKSITPQIIQTQENVLHQQLDINQILGDEKGNIWIGTEGDGLFHFNRYQKKFSPIMLRLDEFPLISNISTFQFLPEKDSALWLGTKYGMVKYFYKTGAFKFYDSKERPLIYTITNDNDNIIWAGGFTSGLLKYDKFTDTFQKIELSLPDDEIIEIRPLEDHNLLICTWAGGIYKYNRQTGKTTEYLIEGKRINRARTSLIDSKGNLWLGTDHGAFCITKTEKVLKYDVGAETKHNLSSERVFDIAEDFEGNIWFGTNVGLTKLDTKSQNTTFYYAQKGLPNDFIYSVLIAKNNDVWVSTNYGISVLNKSTNLFSNFTVSDGLQNNEFNGKAGFQDKEGNFYFGGISGINVFNPDKIIENPNMPKVYIESVDLFNTPLNKNELFKNELRFKSSENVLTFNFAALNFVNPEKCNYSYKMEGFDTDWRPPAKDRNTTYTNLDPGTYFFYVKATNDAGIWSPNIDSIKVTIVPPWYATTWFRILFVVAFLISGIIYYLYQTSKLKNEKVKLERIVAHRTRQVQQKNKELKNAFLEAASQRDNIRFLMKELQHRVNNNLQITSSLLNIQAKSATSHEVVNVLEMAKNRIMAIAYVESKIRNDSESVNIGTFVKDISESIIQALSEEKHMKFTPVYEISDFKLKNINTTLIGLVLNELITNATKYAFDNYSKENIVRIGCSITENKLILYVTDNGKGYHLNNKRNNSLGLNLVSSLVEQLGGTLKIESMNGTKNTIEIPV